MSNATSETRAGTQRKLEQVALHGHEVGFLRAGEAVGSVVERFGLHVGPDVAEFARGYASLADADARGAFLNTLRAVIDPGGQRVSALDRLYLAEQMPFLVLWGREDPIIPVEHGRYASALVPGS